MPRVPFDWSPYEAEIRSLHTAGYAQERILDKLANRYPEQAFATRRSLSIQLESWGLGRRYKPQEDPEILEFIKSKWRKNATHAEILDHIQKVFPDVAISDRTLRRVRKKMKLLYRTPGGMMGNAERRG